MKFKTPWPYFGGKSSVADLIWQAFGNVKNYVEPFFGSGAVLFGRPGWYPGVNWIEKVNDKDAYVTNAFRSIKKFPEQVAEVCNFPASESENHSRHSYLARNREVLSRRIEGDVDFCDPVIAGYWIYTISLNIRISICNSGPWFPVKDSEGFWQLLKFESAVPGGIIRSRSKVGSGVPGVISALQKSGGNPQDGGDGILSWFLALQERLLRTIVLCGDWSRMVTDCMLTGPYGVFFDPPYSSDAGRQSNLYSVEDLSVSHRVRDWAIKNGDNPELRICFAGYTSEFSFPANWQSVNWKANGGYSNFGHSKANRGRECLWFSPHCLKVQESS